MRSNALARPIARRRLVAGAALAFARPARAQTSVPAALGFAAWMQRHEVTAGSIALAVGGQLVVLDSYGGLDPLRPAPVWSLSKYVTGLAAARLVAAGLFGFDTPLATAAPGWFATPEGAASALAAVTVGQLLSHRSGLSQAAGDAAAAGLRARVGWPPAERMASLLALRPRRAPGEAYEYANVNFLLVGLLVEAVAGEPYGAFTDRAVLAALGVAPRRLDPVAGVLAAAGGWSFTGPEYLALLVGGLAPRGLVLPGVRRWMEAPAGKTVAPGSTVFYSLGLRHRPAGRGLVHWHGGNWQVRTPEGTEDSSGTLAVLAADSSACFACFHPYPGLEAQTELERELLRM